MKVCMYPTKSGLGIGRVVDTYRKYLPLMIRCIVRVSRKGGAGSGNWGHAGRPGLIGGSGGSGGAGGAGAVGARQLWGDNLTVEGYSNWTVKGMLNDLARVPSRTVSRLKEHGISIVMGDKLLTSLDDLGHLKGVRPQGWPRGRTWDDVKGAYSRVTNTVVLTSKGGPNYGSASTALHEVGHAIDLLLRLSSSPVTVEAHSGGGGAKGLPDFYTQSGNVGRREFTAETIALLYGSSGSEAAATRFAGADYVSWLRGELE